MGTALRARESRLARVRLPMSQKVICCRAPLGSETYLIMVTPALHRAMTMEPASTRLNVWVYAARRLTRYVRATAAIPPAKAASWISQPGR